MTTTETFLDDCMATYGSDKYSFFAGHTVTRTDFEVGLTTLLALRDEQQVAFTGGEVDRIAVRNIVLYKRGLARRVPVPYCDYTLVGAREASHCFPHYLAAHNI